MWRITFTGRTTKFWRWNIPNASGGWLKLPKSISASTTRQAAPAFEVPWDANESLTG